ncbi:uncharacterized protein LOC127436011 [Myxocyprinus asiaticus]|uniref:uncharacterized protein LOC127436011 n=1 Tax=Myxocyprinus asiaticus TaxID=70543 RepID=UPI002221F9FD|nr:uncharacterized protein LOC127436011 [Myxocyprinus asiaticus]
MAHLRAELVVHRCDAWATSFRRVIDMSTLRRYWRRARDRVPALFQRLRESPSPNNLRVAQGMIAGYLVVSSGHRRCVIANMTVEEFRGAGELDNGERVVAVRHHKTAAFFGRANVAFNPEEYRWVSELLELRGGESLYCFCAPKGGLCTALLTQFRSAWKCLKLPGAPSFKQIRTSIVTHGFARLQRAQRDRLSLHVPPPRHGCAVLRSRPDGQGGMQGLGVLGALPSGSASDSDSAPLRPTDRAPNYWSTRRFSGSNPGGLPDARLATSEADKNLDRRLTFSGSQRGELLCHAQHTDPKSGRLQVI